ncbi:hypothetical protein [Helicobacter japonicus]|uniref:hypothetical protein n=1 Tax=Helicobacter japonicus TaxID=425400 RepID=UPI000AC5ABE2|nr:hypothetical protein [Helicobacter japonicus]
MPQDYAHHIHYDSTRVGSHKDIFPTLYAYQIYNILLRGGFLIHNYKRILISLFKSNSIR